MRLMKNLLLTLILFKGTAHAQVIVDTAKIATSGLGLGPALSLSNIDYEDENGNIFKIERKTIGLGIIGNIGHRINLLFQLGYNFKSELEDSKPKGSGYMLGGGINFEMVHKNKFSLIGYSLLNYVTDTFGKGKPKFETDLTDLHLGILGLVKANSVVSLYGGLDLVPYSDGEIKYGKARTDIERDEALNLKLGLELALGSATLKPEATLIGEKTFTIMATFDI